MDDLDRLTALLDATRTRGGEQVKRVYELERVAPELIEVVRAVKDPHTGIAAARRLQRALDALDAKLAEVLGDG